MIYVHIHILDQFDDVCVGGQAPGGAAHVFVHINMYIYVFVHINMYVFVHINIYLYVFVHINMYIHVYMYTPNIHDFNT